MIRVSQQDEKSQHKNKAKGMKILRARLYELERTRHVGQKKAREIWFLCKQYSAQEALEMGMVNKVVPLEKLEETVLEWCALMQKRSPLALRMIKRSLNAELDGQHGLMQLAGDATLLYYLTEEAQEGKEAFLEKRDPNFRKYPKFP